jgi:hypothetical protein
VTSIRELADERSAFARMARFRGQGTLGGDKEAEMEVLWTTVSYAVVAGGAVLAAFILARWLGAGRH